MYPNPRRPLNSIDRGDTIQRRIDHFTNRDVHLLWQPHHYGSYSAECSYTAFTYFQHPRVTRKPRYTYCTGAQGVYWLSPKNALPLPPRKNPTAPTPSAPAATVSSQHQRNSCGDGPPSLSHAVDRGRKRMNLEQLPKVLSTSAPSAFIPSRRRLCSNFETMVSAASRETCQSAFQSYWTHRLRGDLVF